MWLNNGRVRILLSIQPDNLDAFCLAELETHPFEGGEERLDLPVPHMPLCSTQGGGVEQKKGGEGDANLSPTDKKYFRPGATLHTHNVHVEHFQSRLFFQRMFCVW